MGRIPCPANKRSNGKRDYLRPILRFDKLTVPRKIEGQPGYLKASLLQLGVDVQPCLGPSRSWHNASPSNAEPARHYSPTLQDPHPKWDEAADGIAVGSSSLATTGERRTGRLPISRRMLSRASLPRNKSMWTLESKKAIMNLR